MSDPSDLPYFEALAALTERARRDPLPYLDGEAAPETQAIARAIGANGFALNRWWVVTPRTWICPACKRGKADIARLNQRGEMMGDLHAHHDHIGDYIKRRFHEVSASRGTVVADENAERFVARAAPLVRSYDDTVICSDCNGADGKAKRLVPTHPDFSFSPEEIGRFVISHRNRDHEINVDLARSIWRERMPVFTARLEIIERIVSLAAGNQHWFQPSAHHDHPDSIDHYAVAELVHAGYPKDGCLPAYIDGARTIRKVAQDLSAWRKRRPGRPKIPTPGQVEHVAKVSHIGFWKQVPESWTCPACGRTKTSIVKPSTKFAWSIELPPGWFYDGAGGRTQIRVCGDCNNACLAMAKEAGVERARVSIQDVRNIVIPTPHAAHSFRDDSVVMPIIDRIRSRPSVAQRQLF